MTTTTAKLVSVAELPEAYRRAVGNDLESIASPPVEEFGQSAGNPVLETSEAKLLGEYLVDSNIALRDGKIRHA